MINGELFLNQTRLHETEFAHDPKTPITESYIPSLIEKSSKYKVGLITHEDLASGIERKLEEFYRNNIPYILFDSSTEEDLHHIVEKVSDTAYRLIWAGSAGLATQLVKKIKKDGLGPISSEEMSNSVLLVVGSVNKKIKNSLNYC